MRSVKWPAARMPVSEGLFHLGEKKSRLNLAFEYECMILKSCSFEEGKCSGQQKYKACMSPFALTFAGCFSCSSCCLLSLKVLAPTLCAAASCRIQVRRGAWAALLVLSALAMLSKLSAAFDNCNDDGVCVLKHNDCSDTGMINGSVKCTSDPSWY